MQDGQDIKPSERIAAKQALPHLQLQLVAELQAEGIDPEAAGQVCLPGVTDTAWPSSAHGSGACLPGVLNSISFPLRWRCLGLCSAQRQHASVKAHMLPWPAVHATTSSMPAGSPLCAAPLHYTAETLARRWFSLLSTADTALQVEDDSVLEDLVVQETGHVDESGEMRRPWWALNSPSVTRPRWLG